MDKNNPMQWTMVANCAGGTWEKGASPSATT